VQSKAKIVNNVIYVDWAQLQRDCNSCQN